MLKFNSSTTDERNATQRRSIGITNAGIKMRLPRRGHTQINASLLHDFDIISLKTKGTNFSVHAFY